MEIIPVNSGFSAYLIKRNKFKTFVICLLIRRNLNKKEVTLNSLLSSVLEQGSAEFPESIDIARYMEDLFGGVFSVGVIKKGNEQILQFYGEVVNLKNNDLLIKLIKFINEIVTNPLLVNGEFNTDIVENEKLNLTNLLNNKKNNKSVYATNQCLKEMFNGELFGIHSDGYLEDLEQITSKSLYNHYQNILPNSIINLMLIGDFNSNTENIIKENFKFLGENVKNIKHNYENNYKKRNSILYIHENEDISQGQLVMGYRSDINPLSSEYIALLILNEILGGGGNSRLFVNVRESESMCYSIHSSVYRHSSSLLIQAGIDLQQVDKAKELIMKQIKNISTDLDTKEFDECKKSFLQKTSLIDDSPQSLINFYATQNIMGDKINFSGFQDKIKNVSIDEVRNIANRLDLDTVYTLGKIK